MQTVQIIPDRVVTVLCQYRRQSVIYFVLSGYVVVTFQPYTQIRIVPVAPLLRLPVPRQTACYHIVPGKLIVRNAPFQCRVILQHQYYVLDIAQQFAGFGVLQFGFPLIVIIFRHFHIAEVISHGRAALPCHQQFYVFVSRRHFLHRRKGRFAGYVRSPAALILCAV